MKLQLQVPTPGAPTRAVIVVEHLHPRDDRFVAYQTADGRWLTVDSLGQATFTTEPDSFGAFVRVPLSDPADRTPDRGYVLADRSASALNHGVFTPAASYALAYVAVPQLTGPVA